MRAQPLIKAKEHSLCGFWLESMATRSTRSFHFLLFPCWKTNLVFISRPRSLIVVPSTCSSLDKASGIITQKSTTKPTSLISLQCSYWKVDNHAFKMSSYFVKVWQLSWIFHLLGRHYHDRTKLIRADFLAYKKGLCEMFKKKRSEWNLNRSIGI